MHTSAHVVGAGSATEPDMFGAEAPAPSGALLEFSGVLAHDAEVRVKASGDGRPHLPVLCLDVLPANGAGTTLHAEQVYTEAQHELALQRAAALRKGTRITLTAPLDGMRVFLPRVQSVTSL